MIAGQGSLNFIIRSGLLLQLKEFCEPVLCMSWEQPDLQAEMKQAGIEVHVIPSLQPTAAYLRLRQQIDDWYYKKVLCSPGTKLEYNYKALSFSSRKKWSKRKGSILESMKRTFLPGYIKNLVAQEKIQIQQQEGYAKIQAWFTDLQVDAYFTATPFLLASELLGRFCRAAGKPAWAAICSFDNVTKRGWPAMAFDHYIVWNKYNRAELQRIFPHLGDTDISITGAPQFDNHFTKSNELDRYDWLKSQGLPADKKIILYGGGPVNLFPGETQYLRHLKEGLEAGAIKNAVVLFRSHPLDKMQRWLDEVGPSAYIFYDQAPTGSIHPDYTNLRETDIRHLLASLKFTDVHINLCSTMAVDGSIFNKPQIAPYYDAEKPAWQQPLRRLYLQEHYRPILKTKAIHFAESKENLVDLVNACLKNPGQFISGSQNCVQEIISFTDGKSATRVAHTLQNLLGT